MWSPKRVAVCHTHDSFYAQTLTLPMFQKFPKNTSTGNKLEAGACDDVPQRTWRVLALATGLLLLLSGLLKPQIILKTCRGFHTTDLGEESIGTVKWWNCKGPRDAPGTECGYIM